MDAAAATSETCKLKQRTKLRALQHVQMTAVQAFKIPIASVLVARLAAAEDAPKEHSNGEEKHFTGQQDLAMIAHATVVRQLITSTPTPPPGRPSTLGAVMVWHGNGPKLNLALHLMDAAAATSNHAKLKKKIKLRA